MDIKPRKVIRECGFYFAFWSVVFASFNPLWQVNVLLGIFSIGAGVGLWLLDDTNEDELARREG